jgi:hypothetical protein
MTTPRAVKLTTAAEQVLGGYGIRLYKIIPQATTTGTITLREAAATGGSNIVFTVAAAQAAAIGGVEFGSEGVVFDGGLTVQLSVAGDNFLFICGAK